MFRDSRVAGETCCAVVFLLVFCATVSGRAYYAPAGTWVWLCVKVKSRGRPVCDPYNPAKFARCKIKFKCIANTLLF